MRTCQVCGRLYTGYQCPCRRKQRRHYARRAAGSGRRSRKWAQAEREARVLGGWGADTAPVPEAFEHAGAEQWYVCPRCDTVFQGERCPACFERWQAEMAGAGYPAHDVDPGDLPAADFCPES